ncbi:MULTISPECIES: DUF6526 family protein [Paenibacillus]|uniref:DUF6526 family protein n=1 Tax=Paenibacillus TaxID=44249 RepID=UPI0022B85CAF|nr:DUF6526 family protein [Paenibacillus caseinilyticus]MCZ8521390.1 DUF6526 family protein [Paenibacillus caseinilyticus]
MSTQNYSNHRMMDPLYHYVLLLLTLIVSIGAIVRVVQGFLYGGELFLPLLAAGLAAMGLIAALRLRMYALKAQDRAIRAEEQLRHFMLTGMPIDTRLSMNQIVALRFASNGELPDLSRRAAEQKLSPDEIKKQIHSWREDSNRL